MPDAISATGAAATPQRPVERPQTDAQQASQERAREPEPNARPSEAAESTSQTADETARPAPAASSAEQTGKEPRGSQVNLFV